MVELEQKVPEFLTFRHGGAEAITSVQDSYRPTNVANILSTLGIKVESPTLYEAINRLAPDSRVPRNPSDLSITFSLTSDHLQKVVGYFIKNQEAEKDKNTPSRKPLNAPLSLRGPDEKPRKGSRNPRSQKKPPRNSIPMLPHAQEIKPLPTSERLWDSKQTKKRQEAEALEALRQKFKLDITLNVVSLIRANEVKELKKIAKDTSHGSNTYEISFDSAIGIDSKEDKETKERKRKEFAVTAVNETLDRLSGKQLKLVTPKERHILDMYMDLQQNGKNIQDVKKAVREGLGVDIPEGPNLTSSPVLVYPKDIIHF